MKLPKLSPLKLFAPATPRLAPAGAGGTMMFASGTGGDPYDGPGDAGSVDDPDQPARRSPRAGRGGDGGGRQRTIQFQPEDRYWTEYLRIALPVIGLLLMLGLFWFWAQALIADDNDPDEPTNTEVAEANPGAVSTETIAAPPESTPPPAQPTETPAEDQQPAADGADEAATEPEPAEEEASGDNQAEEEQPPEEEQQEEAAELAVNTAAVVSEGGDGLRLREDPVVEEGNEIVELSAGDALTIVGGPEEGEDYTWWEVETADGETGWVAGDFIQPAD